MAQFPVISVVEELGSLPIILFWFCGLIQMPLKLIKFYCHPGEQKFRLNAGICVIPMLSASFCKENKQTMANSEWHCLETWLFANILVALKQLLIYNLRSRNSGRKGDQKCVFIFHTKMSQGPPAERYCIGYER